jgi:acyl dehydratase
MTGQTTGHTTGGDAGIGLLVRAALPALPVVNLLPGIRKTGSGDLAGLARTRPPLEIRREHVTAYAAVCGFPEKDTVPLTYPHVLGFPLHLQVMTDPGFPFPAMGSVHLTNAITAHRAIAIGETVEVGVRPENLQPHAKGRTVDFVTEVTSAGELVWEGRSTYLRRGPAGDPGSAGAPSGPVFDEVETSGVTWSLPGDLGRRYAAVSGDRNPIHLYALTARALGFKRQIAHGMWTKARCVAALENRLPDAVTVEVAFKKPVFLPGRVAFGSKPTDTGYAFALSDPRSGAPHLQGRAVRAEDSA